MLQIYYKSIRDEKFLKIDDLRVGSLINISDANIDDLKKISEITHIEIDDILDTLDKYEIPRIEHVNDKIIVYARNSSDLEKGMHTITIAILLTDSYIATISPQKSKIIESIIEGKNKLATTQKSKLLLYILLKITQDFTSNIKQVRNVVLAQEQQMQTITNKAIVVLTKNEEILNQYLSSLVPLRNVLEAIFSGRYISLYEKDYDLLQDLMIAVKQSEDLCSISIKSIRSLRDSYQILFTNDVNKTIKLLTAITIIFTIPTIIASIYGMNVKLPLETNPHAFLIIITFTIIISLFSIFIFARKKWL
ncbi:MAG: Cobalt/magnesium transport protein CorA [Candidatus Anoxychlamydiales bacterium]|nr:Cobalt/magnesium transport protein CorA [Candidatus Anoxychlamydiales bacterium]